MANYPNEVTITLTRAEVIELNWQLDPTPDELFFYAEPNHYASLAEKIIAAHEKVTGLREDLEE